MYCSIALSTSECAHVFVGGAEHTIVKLPTNCGRGPFARVASLDLHPNQDVLSTYHQSQKPADEPVYLLKFDYGKSFISLRSQPESYCPQDFSVIPAANGPIYMRAGTISSGTILPALNFFRRHGHARLLGQYRRLAAGAEALVCNTIICRTVQS